MREWIRTFPVPSIEVPVARERLRVLEVLLALLVIAVPLLTAVLPAGGLGPLVDFGLLVVFVVPPVLALVALVGAIDDGLSIGEVSISLLALATLYTASVSVYVLINPPEGGGVYGGHLFTFAAGLVLAVGILVRTAGIVVIRKVNGSPV